MKQKIFRLLLFGFLLPLPIAAIFSSCEAEKDFTTENSRAAKRDHEVTFEEFKKETKLYNFKTNITIPNTINRSLAKNADGSYELSDFDISTDIIKRLDLHDKFYYTFRIYPKDGGSPACFYNLILYNKGNDWVQSIVELKPTPESYQLIVNGQTEKVDGKLKLLFKSDNTTLSGGGCIFIEIVNYHCTHTGICLESGHCDNCSYCVSYDMSIVCDYDWSGGGSGGGSGDGGAGPGGPSAGGGVVIGNVTNSNNATNSENLYSFVPNVQDTNYLDGNPTNRKFPCMTTEALHEIFPNASIAHRNILANYVQLYAKYFNIDTPEELQHYLAQVGAETGGLTTLNVSENLNYSSASRLVTVWPSKFTLTGEAGKADPTPYLHNPAALANYVYCCGKLGNGDIASEDGWTYRGRGIFQLTGKTNYNGYQQYLNSIGLGWWYTDPDNLALPDGLHAVLSSMWFYKNRVLDKMDIDANTTANQVTRKVNKWTDKASKQRRRDYLVKAKAKINC